MAVINFCNALASYEANDLNPDNYSLPQSNANNNSSTNTSNKVIRGVPRFARIFQCPPWIVTCRNNLSHPSQYPPTLDALHEAVSYALQWMDRFFWAKLLGDQCRLVDVDLRVSSGGSSMSSGSDTDSVISQSPHQFSPTIRSSSHHHQQKQQHSNHQRRLPHKSITNRRQLAQFHPIRFKSPHCPKFSVIGGKSSYKR